MSHPTDGQTFKNLLVTKLPREFKDEDLLAAFIPYGGFDAKVMLDATTGVSKRFGFVQFHSEEEGKRAIELVDGKTLDGYGKLCFRIFPSKYNAEQSVKPSTCLYVKNVPAHVPRNDVFALLSSFGAVEVFSVKQDRNGPFWYITVTYDSIPVAERALKGLHNQRIFAESPVPVLAKFADSLQVRGGPRRDASRSMDDPSRSYDAPPLSEPLPPPPLPSAPATIVTPVRGDRQPRANPMDAQSIDVPFVTATNVAFPKFKRPHHYSAAETAAGMSFDIESSTSRSYTPTGAYAPNAGGAESSPLSAARRAAKENSTSLGSSSKFRYDPYGKNSSRVDVPDDV